MKPRIRLAEKVCDFFDSNFGNFKFGSGYFDWQSLDVMPIPTKKINEVKKEE